MKMFSREENLYVGIGFLVVWTALGVYALCELLRTGVL